MNRISVDSSNLRSVGYENGILEIEFNNGSVYVYYGVPEHVYKGLMEADSHGIYFYYNIREKSYRYEQIL